MHHLAEIVKNPTSIKVFGFTYVVSLYNGAIQWSLHSEIQWCVKCKEIGSKQRLVQWAQLLNQQQSPKNLLKLVILRPGPPYLDQTLWNTAQLPLHGNGAFVMEPKSEELHLKGIPRSELYLRSLQCLNSEHYHWKEAWDPNCQACTWSLWLHCTKRRRTGSEFTRWCQSDQLPVFEKTVVPKDLRAHCPGHKA